MLPTGLTRPAVLLLSYFYSLISLFVFYFPQQPPVPQDDTVSHPEKRKSTGETPESAKKRKSKALDVDLPNAPLDGRFSLHRL